MTSLDSHLRMFFFLALVVVLSQFVYGQNPALVTTVAGGFVGDGKSATAAALSGASNAAEDSQGNLYIADYGNSRIRKVDTMGVITTFAGTGIYGYSGDGGPATAAALSIPTGVAVDKTGNVFFSDHANLRIRKIDTNGIITTFAGNGTSGPAGDGGPAINASLFWPTALAFDTTGNLFIADDGPTIRMVDTAGIIHRVAGVYNNFGFGGDGGPATSAMLNNPEGLAFDGNGNLYIADIGSHRIRRVDSSGIITTFAGNGNSSCPETGDGGAATLASIPSPGGLVVFRNSVLVSDACLHIRAVDLNTGIITTTAGTGAGCFNGDGLPPLSTDLCASGLLLDSGGNLLATDGIRVRRITDTVQTIAGGYIGDGGFGTEASITSLWPGGRAAFDDGGNLYIADTYHGRIRKLDTSGIITTFAGTGLDGSSGDGGPATSATFQYPNSVTADHSGNVFIGEAGGMIRKVDSTGTISAFATGFFFVTGLAADMSGNVYAADYGACVVWKVTSSGAASVFAGLKGSCGYNGDGMLATEAEIYPLDVATDAKGDVYIADYVNNRIRMVDPNGTISTVAGSGFFGFGGDGGAATSAALLMPVGVSTDSKGNLYVADTGNLRLRVVNSAGIINTIAGTGQQGYNGDGLPATQANLSPGTVAVNPKGIPYVWDSDGDRIRMITGLTQTSLTSSLNPAVVNQSVTYTALVNGQGATPTGSVIFTIDSNLPVVVPLSNGEATYTWAFALTGPYTVTASYSGDSSNAPSTSGALAQQVNPLPSTQISLTSSLNPSVVNQPVTYSAVVSGQGGAMPTGTVTFTINGNKPVTEPLISGQATFTWTFLYSGPRAVTASYSGDTNNASSISTALAQQVNPLVSTQTSLASSLNPSVVNQPVTYTAVVSGQGGAMPTGTVTFTINGNKPVTEPLISGQATFTWTFLYSGPRTVTASYSGDANNASSVSTTLAQQVNPLVSTQISLTSSLNPSVVNQPVTYSAVVGGQGGAMPTGTVTFTINGNKPVTEPLSSGQATFTWTFLYSGPRTVTASYSGDANNASSISTTLAQQINPLVSTQTSLTSPLNPSVVNQSPILLW